MSANSSSDEFDDEKPQRAAEPINGQPGGSPNEEEEEEEEEEDDDEEDDSDEDDTEDEGEAVEGAYDPADYANLPVSTEIKEMFQYITRCVQGRPKTTLSSNRMMMMTCDVMKM